MNKPIEIGQSKIPAVAIGFGVIKILGETAGDAVTLIGTVAFAVILVVAVAAQIAARRFHRSFTRP